MKLVTPKYFWITLAVITFIEGFLYIWNYFDDSCNNGAFICITLPIIFFLYVFIASPIVFLITYIIGLVIDFKNNNLSLEIKTHLKQGIRIFSLSFFLSTIVKSVWDYNYDIYWSDVFFTAVILFFASLMISIIYVQIKVVNRIRTNPLQ